MDVWSRVAAAIAAASGNKAEIASTSRQVGGSISDAYLIRLNDGRSYFVKTLTHAERYPGMFATEYQALELLRSVNAIRVPEPVATGAGFIVMEAYTAGSKADNWQEKIGRQLAQLHQATGREALGFGVDNYIGTTPQLNTACDTWVGFWRERRLNWQLDRFAAAGNQGDPLFALGWELSEALDDILDAPAEPAVLLHGDLWSGNAAADERGAPIIYDPASYYGHREAEFGMMQMFGGFDGNCNAAYHEFWPLADGYERRIEVYRLYHELNHLNLFGRSYYDRCALWINARAQGVTLAAKNPRGTHGH